MEDVKFQVTYRNKIYDFDYGSQAYIFHTGIYRNVQRFGIRQLLEYVDLVHVCYIKDINRTPLGALADYIAEHWKQVKDKPYDEILDRFYLTY